ncbi:MAG: DUF6384 family protein [Desulfobacterales bacterium]
MSETEKSDKIELNEVMLAMDVVDTLRHQKSIVDRELKAEDHDQALIEKVRKIYAGQGLEVSDETIAMGVKALREERFTYIPPKKSFQLMLAHLYVNRGRWAKRGALVAAAFFGVYLVYQFAYVVPQNRSRKKDTQEINLRIGQQQDQISVAKERVAHLANSLSKIKQNVPHNAAVGFKGLVGEAEREIVSAQGKIQSLEKLALKPGIDADKAAKTGVSVSQRLDQRAKLISALKIHLDNADQAVTSLGGLKVLPGKLADQRDRILAVARENGAKQQAQELYSDAMTAIGRGDIKAVQKGYSSLQLLYDQLVQEYKLRIVSRQGMQSGVWRYPKSNSKVRNYYIIVEAVTSDGRGLTVPITSEEDGQTHNVKQWGLRVKDSVFDQIKRDKEDDGIISRNVFGIKRRGYLQPQYLIPTTGGAITQW